VRELKNGAVIVAAFLFVLTGQVNKKGITFYLLDNDYYKEVNKMAIIFLGLWVGLTVPIALSVVFAMLKPIVMIDNTGISMIIIGLLVAIVDGYIGIKIYENKIEPLLERRIFRNWS
jgi:hypothetical protein